MRKPCSYPKKEKLKSRKQLAGLFAQKQSFFVFPLKIFYSETTQVMDSRVKVGVGATSRNFKKATDRNRIKRVLREAYRQHKLPLHKHLMQQNKQLILFFLYVDKSLPDKALLPQKMPFIIRELINRLHETAS